MPKVNVRHSYRLAHGGTDRTQLHVAHTYNGQRFDYQCER